MPDPDSATSPLDAALIEACEFAIAHGVEKPIQPADFGLQRSDAGSTIATYVDSSHVITVHIDRHGCAAFGVAELSWVHFPDPDPDEECWYCAQPLSMRTVYLPGDAPCEKALAGG